MISRGKFLTPLLLTPLTDGKRWRVEGPFTYSLVGGGHVIVASNFITDLASIPPLAWIGAPILMIGIIFIPLIHILASILMAIGLAIVMLSPFFLPFGKYTEAAVLHDWLYRNHLFPRWMCDGLLLEAMEVSKVPRWQRLIIYYNVRMFGWIAWSNEKRSLRNIGHR